MRYYVNMSKRPKKRSRQAREFVLKIVCLLSIVVLTILCIVGVSSYAHAANEMPIEWDQPLFDTNNEPMPIENIANFELHYTVDKPFEINETPIIIEAGETGTYALKLNLKPNPEPHSVHVALRTVTIYGVKSDMSNIVSQSFLVSNTAKPAAPVNIRLELRCDSKCEIILIDIED